MVIHPALNHEDVADAIVARCEEAERVHRNWTWSVIGDEGYPAEIVLSTAEARQIASIVKEKRK